MITGFFASGVSMIAQHLSVHLEMRGLDIVMISAVMGIWSLMLGLFKIAEGYLYDKLPERAFVGATMFFGAVGYLALCGRGMAWLMLGVVGYAWGAASNTVLYPLTMRRLYGKELASATWGICYAAFMAGGAVWTPVYGGVFDMTGSYNPALIASGVILVFSTIYVAALLGRKAKNGK